MQFWRQHTRLPQTEPQVWWEVSLEVQPWGLHSAAGVGFLECRGSAVGNSLRLHQEKFRLDI